MWSISKKTVPVTKLLLINTTWQGETYSELQVYFPVSTWDRRADGLIYTDPLWIKELRKHLRDAGYSVRATNDISYSEQGMQGVNYVSLDAGKQFVKEQDAFYQFACGNTAVSAIVDVHNVIVNDD